MLSVQVFKQDDNSDAFYIKTLSLVTASNINILLHLYRRHIIIENIEASVVLDELHTSITELDRFRLNPGTTNGELMLINNEKAAILDACQIKPCPSFTDQAVLCSFVVLLEYGSWLLFNICALDLELLRQKDHPNLLCNLLQLTLVKTHEMRPNEPRFPFYRLVGGPEWEYFWIIPIRGDFIHLFHLYYEQSRMDSPTEAEGPTLNPVEAIAFEDHVFSHHGIIWHCAITQHYTYFLMYEDLRAAFVLYEWSLISRQFKIVSIFAVNNSNQSRSCDNGKTGDKDSLCDLGIPLAITSVTNASKQETFLALSFHSCLLVVPSASAVKVRRLKIPAPINHVFSLDSLVIIQLQDLSVYSVDVFAPALQLKKVKFKHPDMARDKPCVINFAEACYFQCLVNLPNASSKEPVLLRKDYDVYLGVHYVFSADLKVLNFNVLSKSGKEGHEHYALKLLSVTSTARLPFSPISAFNVLENDEVNHKRIFKFSKCPEYSLYLTFDKTLLLFPNNEGSSSRAAIQGLDCINLDMLPTPVGYEAASLDVTAIVVHNDSIYIAVPFTGIIRSLRISNGQFLVEEVVSIVFSQNTYSSSLNCDDFQEDLVEDMIFDSLVVIDSKRILGSTKLGSLVTFSIENNGKEWILREKMSLASLFGTTTVKNSFPGFSHAIHLFDHSERFVIIQFLGGIYYLLKSNCHILEIYSVTPKLSKDVTRAPSASASDPNCLEKRDVATMYRYGFNAHLDTGTGKFDLIFKYTKKAGDRSSDAGGDLVNYGKCILRRERPELLLPADGTLDINMSGLSATIFPENLSSTAVDPKKYKSKKQVYRGDDFSIYQCNPKSVAKNQLLIVFSCCCKNVVCNCCVDEGLFDLEIEDIPVTSASITATRTLFSECFTKNGELCCSPEPDVKSWHVWITQGKFLSLYELQSQRNNLSKKKAATLGWNVITSVRCANFIRSFLVHPLRDRIPPAQYSTCLNDNAYYNIGVCIEKYGFVLYCLVPSNSIRPHMQSSFEKKNVEASKVIIVPSGFDTKYRLFIDGCLIIDMKDDMTKAIDSDLKGPLIAVWESIPSRISILKLGQQNRLETVWSYTLSDFVIFKVESAARCLQRIEDVSISSDLRQSSLLFAANSLSVLKVWISEYDHFYLQLDAA